MSPEQAKLNELFSQALTKAPGEERARFLAEACGGDPELRRQLDSLLEAQAESGDFLCQNVIDGDHQGISEGPGCVIGRYKLLQQIGEGGFGVVFMAEQQEPVRRMVALKIIKAGMDTREVISRFEAERQALALMDHPNLARVLDGGATASGRPYFVMELIKGIPITGFCEEHNLSIEARLQLFMKVCAGVQHAHQKGVIHRDIKPSNVLVTLHDGEPVPKVIDFGVAKAIGQKLTQRTLFTRFEQLIGTPAYMSPEQAEWSGLDIDTRSDLYSLGVLLYELLTGTTPLEKETLACAALDEMRRMIRETDPPKPSTRLTALATANSAPSPPHLTPPKVRGDLDWIVMKCLEKDRARRYETVNGLARDIERHLGGEPVVACPPSRTYMASKFIRKHRVGVVAVAGVALALVVGLALAVLGFAQASGERHRARDEASRANAISDFLQKDLLQQAGSINLTNREVTITEVVDRAAANVAERFPNQPLVEAAIRQTLGEIYVFHAQYQRAEAQLQPAFEAYNRIFGPEHDDTLKTLNRLIETKIRQQKYSEAEPLMRHLVEISHRMKSPESEATLKILFTLAFCYSAQGRREESSLIYRDLLETNRRVIGSESAETLSIMNNLARDDELLGRGEEAVTLYEEMLRFSHQRPHLVRYYAAALCHRADHYMEDDGDFGKAAELLNEALTLERKIYGPQHPWTISTIWMLSFAYGAIGSWSSCATLCHEGAQSTNELKHLNDFAYQGAIASLLQNDTNSFHDFASRLLAQHATTTNAVWARETAEICLLTPGATLDLDRVFGLVELAAKSERCQLNHIVCGMADYRRGNLQEALRWFEPLRGSVCGWVASQAGYFCAMIHYRQGDVLSARTDLDEAARQLSQYVSRGLYRDWHTYGRAVVIRSEAERLILGREVSTILRATDFEAGRKHWAPVQHSLNQAETLACSKKWTAASAEYLAALNNPVFTWETALNSEYEFARAVGLAFLLAKDYPSHERLVGTLFSFLEGHPDPFLARDVMEICLASPRSATNSFLRKATNWSLPIEGSPNQINIVRMLMAYRAGRFQEAIERAKAAELSERLGVRIAAQLFRCMSLARLGRTDAGKHAFEETEALLASAMANIDSDERCDFGLCQLALDEAHQLFAASPAK